MMKPDHRYANSQSQQSTDLNKISSPHLRRKQLQKQSVSSNGAPIPFQKGWQRLEHIPRTSTQVVSSKTHPHPGAIPKQRDKNKNAKAEHNTKLKPSEGSSPRQRRIVRRKTTGDSLNKVDHHRNISDGLSGPTGNVDKTRPVVEDSEKAIPAQVSTGKISRKSFRQHKAKRESGKKETSSNSLDVAPHSLNFEGIDEGLSTKGEEGEVQEVHDSLTTVLPANQSTVSGHPQATGGEPSVFAHNSGHIPSSSHMRGTRTSPSVAVRHGLPTDNGSRQDIHDLMGIRDSSEHDCNLSRREDSIQACPVVDRSNLSPLGEQIPNSSVRSVLRNSPGSPEHTRILRNRSESSDSFLDASVQEESVNPLQSQSSTVTSFCHASTLTSDSVVNHASARDRSSSLLRRTYPGADTSLPSPRSQSSSLRENLQEWQVPSARPGQSSRLLTRERNNQDYISFRDRQIQRDRDRVRGSIVNPGVDREDRDFSLFALPSSPRSSVDIPVERLPSLTTQPGEHRAPYFSLRQDNETPLFGATSRVDTPPPSPTRHSPLSRQEDRENVASHLAVMACPLFAPLLFELPPAIMLHMLASARRELGDEFVALLIDNIVLSLLTQQMHDAGLTSDAEGRGDRPAPASKETIEGLKKRDVTKSMIDEDPKCAICHVEYELRETLSELPCHHFFHHTCISIWLNKTATCPVCRYKLQSDL